jgi:hypothetical protein
VSVTLHGNVLHELLGYDAGAGAQGGGPGNVTQGCRETGCDDG